MAEETISTLPAENRPGTQPTGDATGTNGGAAFATFATEADFQARVDTLLKERLERAERKAKDAADAAARKATEDAAKQQGEWQKLAEQYEPKAKRADALETFVGDLLATELSGVPDKFTPLIPAFDDPLRLLEWLRNARTAGMFAPPTAPDTGAGQGAMGDGKPRMSEAEKREKAAQLGVDWRYLPDY